MIENEIMESMAGIEYGFLDENGNNIINDTKKWDEEFFEFLKNDAEVSTSQPSLGSILSLWDELLESYDEVIYLPMSSGLSGTCQTATMLAQDYDGRVYVVDNQRISVPLKHSVQDALTMAEMGKSAKDIKEYLERTKCWRPRE